MNAGDDKSELWWIVFTKSNYKHWIFNWINKDYQHCYAIKKSPGKQYWIIVDGKKSHLAVDVYPVELAPTIKDLVTDYTVITSIKVKYDVLKPVHHLTILSCVDVVKGILGMKAFWCWTPFQLLKRLNNEQGAITRKRRSKESSSETSGVAREAEARGTA